MLAKVDQNLNLIFFDDQKIKYDSWLKTHIYQHIPYIDEVNELQDILQRSHLLKQYQSNQAYQCIQHYFLWNQCIQHCKLNVHVFKNPINNHIQAYMFWRNDTEEYIDEQIKNVLYKNDYQAIALIDILHQNVYLRLNHATKEIKENNYIDYQKVIDLVTQNQIAPKYRKQFIKNTSLKNLEENMKYLGHYSFKVFDLENKVVHYSYYWFDQKKKLCFVLLMI